MSRTIMIWKHTTLGILAALAIAAPLSISCEENDEGAGEIPSDRAPETVADVACDRYFACTCEERMGPGERFSSPEACELAVAQDLQEAIDEGNDAELTYNGRCPGLQIDLADTLGCQSVGEIALDLGLASQFEDYESCKLFYGTRGPGQDCEELDESNGDSCEIDLVCRMGICITTDRLAEGEDCDDTADCEAGLVCTDVDGGNDDPTCVALPTGGATCLGELNLCDVDFSCDIASKTCVALPGPDEMCAETPSVLQWRCNRGAICEQDSEICVAAPGGGEQCEGVCQEGFSCEAGRCAEDPAVICVIDAVN